MKNKIELQQGYIDLMKEHSSWMKYAITFTFKSSVFIENKDYASKENSIWTDLQRKMPMYRWQEKERIGHTAYLNDETIDKTIDYFYARLTHRAYGKDSYRTSTRDYSRPVLITTKEGGANTNKRSHIHGVIGHLPNTVNGRDIIDYAWNDTDFGGSIKVKRIYDLDGWLEYITKEVKSGNDTTLQVDRIRKPNTYIHTLA
jgi:virulence-associated protein VapD